jgi:hypothetical protein
MKKLLVVLVVLSLFLVGCSTEPTVPREVPSSPEPTTPESISEPVLMNNPNTFIIDVVVDLESFNPSEEEINEVMEVAKFKFQQLTNLKLELRNIHYLDSLREEGSNTNNPKKMFQYKEILKDKAINGVIVLTKEFNTEVQGGFSVAYDFPDYCNGFKSKYGQNRIYYAYMNWEHKYSICGYKDGQHISDVSIGGECTNQPGTPCVFNGDYYICENAQEDFYSNQINFMGSLFVHELMHPFGESGKYDHYGVNNCPEVSETNSEDAQYYCGLCPNVYENFKNSFVGC